MGLLTTGRLSRLATLSCCLVALLLLPRQTVIGHTQFGLDATYARYKDQKFAVEGADQDYWPLETGSEKGLPAFARSHGREAAAAAFLLEYSEAAYRRGRLIGPAAFDQALEIVRRTQLPPGAARAWYAAALALIEARGAGVDLGSVRAASGPTVGDRHVFPGDSRSPEFTLDKIAKDLPEGDVALARAILKEQVARNGLLVIRTLRGVSGSQQESLSGRTNPRIDLSPNRTKEINLREERKLVTLALDLFDAAAKYPSVAIEADLRRAGLFVFMAEHDDAFQSGAGQAAVPILERIRSADSASPRQRYLARFLLGRYRETQGDLVQAENEYSKAVGEVPTAGSAALALAAVRYVRGLNIDPPVRRAGSSSIRVDPWSGFRFGSYVNWRTLIEEVRNVVR